VPDASVDEDEVEVWLLGVLCPDICVCAGAADATRRGRTRMAGRMEALSRKGLSA
jgi:hypothetical protein